jgi:hypothetical protein
MTGWAGTVAQVIGGMRRPLPTVAFFTVCGGGEEYEFLLGSIEHHATMGRHFVLDTTPAPHARQFVNLPPTVTWIHEPLYGQGWGDFRCRSALARAAGLADQCGAQVVVCLDCDEFYSANAHRRVFARAVDAMIEVFTVHYQRDGTAREYGATEWHRRAWPAKRGVAILPNPYWIAHADFDGNPERHPLITTPSDLDVIRVRGRFHHHLHYAIGGKAERFGTAASVIADWSTGGRAIAPAPWPDKLCAWRDHGTLPSKSFEA